MTVSVIIPAYNAQATIQRCIESVLTQSYRDIQVIIINDGSTDNTSGEIPRIDDRVSVVHTLNRGVSAARNKGLEGTSGEFIAFCDADDYLEPDAIERLVKAMDGADMAVGSFRKFGNFEEIIRSPTGTMNTKHVAEYVMGNLSNPRSNQIFSGCWAKLFKRYLIGRFPDLTTAEDMAFNFDYLRRCKSVKFISDVVYNNLKRNGSLTTSFDENNKSGLFGFLEGLKYVKRFLTPFHPEGTLEDALDRSKVYHSMLYYMRICAQDGGSMRDVLRKLYP